MENPHFHKNLYLALARAGIQLRKLREKSDPIEIHHATGDLRKINFYSERNLGNAKIKRSEEISKFRHQIEKDLIYILQDEIWTEYYKQFPPAGGFQSIWSFIRKKLEEPENHHPFSLEFNAEATYGFDEEPDIKLTDHQAYEKSVIVRALSFLSGINPYENSNNLSSEYFFRFSLKKINLELEKLISQFEDWYRNIDFANQKQKFEKLSNNLNDGNGQQKTILINAVKHSIDIFREAKYLINCKYSIWFYKAGHLNLEHNEIYGIERSQLVTVWGKTISAFNNEAKGTIRVDKEALDVYEFLINNRESYKKLVEINSAIQYLEKKDISCDFKNESQSSDYSFEIYERQFKDAAEIKMSKAKNSQHALVQRGIKVIGFGKAGRIMMSYAQHKMRDYQFIYADTCFEDLRKSLGGAGGDEGSFSKLKILALGHVATNGKGTIGSSEIGKAAIKNSRFIIKNSLKDSKLTFVLAGLGGGTGGEGASEAAEIGKKSMSLVIAILSKPRPSSTKVGLRAKANKTIAEVRQKADGVIVLPNDELDPERLQNYLPLLNYQSKAGIAIHTISKMLTKKEKDCHASIPLGKIRSFFSGSLITRLGSAEIEGYTASEGDNFRRIVVNALDNLRQELEEAKRILVAISKYGCVFGTDDDDIKVECDDCLMFAEEIIKKKCAPGVPLMTWFENEEPIRNNQGEDKEGVRVTIFACFEEIDETSIYRKSDIKEIAEDQAEAEAVIVD